MLVYHPGNNLKQNFSKLIHISGEMKNINRLNQWSIWLALHHNIQEASSAQVISGESISQCLMTHTCECCQSLWGDLWIWPIYSSNGQLHTTAGLFHWIHSHVCLCVYIIKYDKMYDCSILLSCFISRVWYGVYTVTVWTEQSHC